MNIVKKVTIRYFRSIYTLSVVGCSSLNIVSGRNDSGKSNVLRALNLFFNEQTDWQSKLNFYHDFSAQRLDQVRKESIKGKQFISIEIEFLRPTTYSGSLPTTFSVTRTWLRDSMQFQETTNLEALQKRGKLPSSLITAKRGLQTFLNKIHYEYVPAIKDRNYSQHLLARLQRSLLASTVEGATDIPELAKNLAESIQRQVGELQTDFFVATGLSTEIRPPLELSELFQAFHVSTGESTEQSIPLNSRGDGIQARYLSSVLNYIALKSSKFFIWGFEEPENSLEFRYAEELANDFLKNYSKNSQIFITTHSPAFVSLSNSSTSCYRAFQITSRTELVNLANTKFGHAHQDELDHELGVLKIQKEIHDLYAKQLADLVALEISKAEIEKELRESKHSLLLVEGKTDKSIIETAWNKLQSTSMPFRIRVADPAGDGTTGGTGMLAKTIEGVHPDDDRVCVALFDQDKEGIDHFQKLSKNFSGFVAGKSTKKHVNGHSYALLLPAPDFRKDYVKAKNHMIEFMFSDSSLKTKTEGKGLTFKKITPQITIDGKSVDSQTSLFNDEAYATFSHYRKIHDGKDFFAEKIVPILPKEDFSSFNNLFDELRKIPNFFQSIKTVMPNK